VVKRVVVFAPHPDDETLGCGGSVAEKLIEGYEVFVVFMTDGRHALEGFVGSNGPTPSEVKTIRRAEAINATRILGVQENNLFFLDFEDKKLYESECAVRERVVGILKELSPAAVFFPQEREYNVDHRVTNSILRETLGTLDPRPIEYSYIIAWSFPFYPLQHIMTENMFDRVVSGFPKRTLVEVDILRTFSLKEDAIEQYRSQTTRMFSGQKRPVLKHSFLRRFLKSKERFFIN